MISAIAPSSAVIPVSGVCGASSEYVVSFRVDGVAHQFRAYPTPTGPDVSGEPGRYIMVWVENPVAIEDGGMWFSFPSLKPGVYQANELIANTQHGHYSTSGGEPAVQVIIESASDGLLKGTLQGELFATEDPSRRVPIRGTFSMRIPKE